ncbi:NUDIX domain-containing protein [Chelativorans sp. Marseille-P2723]|uniref:NUDIX hydrolase n=1 Tax=Chelativorans sp. Marseille-P2723 TaxID=2709133 RepID=UPI00156DACEA|nr:NUDIX domain-containing protein [Chelativorans sp. Marseille-P2723]
MDRTEIPAVSVVIMRDGRFLLVRRGRAPARGLFAFPGGRIENGETAPEAARRELREETGLLVGMLAPLTEMVLEGDGGQRFRLKVFRSADFEGELQVGDDADLAGWYTVEEMRGLPVTESTQALAETIATGRQEPTWP